MLGNILFIVLILMLLGAIPSWPHSRGWGWSPVGIITTLLTIYIVLVLLGYIDVALFGSFGHRGVVANP